MSRFQKIVAACKYLWDDDICTISINSFYPNHSAWIESISGHLSEKRGPYMWSSCHPKSDEDLKECAELGKSLNRLSQPTILTLLAQSNEPMHGYIIVQQAAHSPMFGGKKPDATGIYRALKRMEETGLVTSEWDTPEEGSAKRLFTLTDKGRRCLRRWIDALACYQLTLEELRVEAANALQIELPDTPVCSHGACN